MNFMKRIWLLGLCLMLAVGVQAQEIYNSSGRTRRPVPQKKSGFDIDRLVWGGGIGFSLWNGTSSFSISPKVGYRITDNFAAGVGFGYQYFQIKDFYQVPNYRTGLYDYYDYK